MIRLYRASIQIGNCRGLYMAQSVVGAKRLRFFAFSTLAKQLKDEPSHHNDSHSHSHAQKALDSQPNAPIVSSSFEKVKAFFNPHTPLKAMGGQSQGHSHTHGHSHSHAMDPESRKLYETKDFWSNPGVKITWVGFGVNVAMAGSKFLGGIYFHSQALIADSVHALGDLVSDVLTLSTVNFSGKGPSELFPLGFGKIETMGALFVSSILLYAGIQIGWGSLIEAMTPLVPQNVMEWVHSLPIHSHSHSHGHEGEGQVANINAAWLALGSIFIKEWLFKTTKKIGEKMNSNVLIANAWHHRVDSMTSIVALVTISGGYFLNVQWLDPVGGLIVSMLIIKVGISGVFQSFKELVDKAMSTSDPTYLEIKNRAETHLMKKDPKLVVKKLVVLPSGTNMNISLTVALNPEFQGLENEITLADISNVSKDLKTNLHQDYVNLKAASIEFDSSAK
ncbi:unnamed protein product [Kuraishia capsulata CBS 1993]|uniref:Cation efflux protein transmembrane domain-containing protein n=1 Tax=Kuraishia capsulata CBS 1993 TaxID=1382522 RepID=W6MWR4_9ASCO|nr:uncharacterized protein KUCA_T00003759001 [Kuraishia capsulata CBS 1993]CDK27780.1 unnamed protein product [Kuraishia capsulata CBS 1993]